MTISPQVTRGAESSAGNAAYFDIQCKSCGFKHNGGSAMIPDFNVFDKQALVDEEIKPNCKGFVYWRATWWSAVCPHNVVLTPGQLCLVVGIRSNTLIVEPI